MTKPKFPMHGYHLRKSLKQCVTAVALSISSGLAFYVFHNLPRKAKYRDFYTNYDPMASFNRMMIGGYLDSCPPPSNGNDSAKNK